MSKQISKLNHKLYGMFNNVECHTHSRYATLPFYFKKIKPTHDIRMMENVVMTDIDKVNVI